MKQLAYIMFSVVYYIACLFPVNKNRYFCVMTHDASDDSSVGVVVKAVKKKYPNAVFTYVKKEDKKLSSLAGLIFVKAAYLAVSGTILMDNEFLPLAYTRIRNDVKVIQLWHGTGTIKKFGHDINEGGMLRLVTRADSRITHLIVNSDYTKNLYGKVFGVSKDKIYVTGIPRTDILFSEEGKKRCIEEFFNVYSFLKGRKLILYAPTFRDNEVGDPKCMLDFDRWVSEADDDMVLLIRLHPHVSAAYDDVSLRKYNGKVLNVSSYDDVNTLLFVSDALITDYSSIIFEYILLDRPMYFYAYDLKLFEDDDRGFYENYEEYVPGKVVLNMDELMAAVGAEDRFENIRKSFKNAAYRYTDGKSTERFMELLEAACGTTPEQ